MQFPQAVELVEEEEQVAVEEEEEPESAPVSQPEPRLLTLQGWRLQSCPRLRHGSIQSVLEQLRSLKRVEGWA